MRPSVHDPDYDPSQFAQDFPEDAQLQKALEAARELSQKIAPRLPGESALEAERRLDQAFDHLRTRFDNDLDKYHEGERAGRQRQFIVEREKEIVAKHQPGINETPVHELKIGGQFARDEEIRLFKQNIGSNQELKTMLSGLANEQAARSEAISHIIKYTPPSPPLEREVEPAPGEPPPPEPPQIKRLKGESEHNYEARVAQMNQPDANASPDALQIQPRRAASFRFRG